MEYIQQSPLDVVYCGFHTPASIATFDAGKLTVLDRKPIDIGRIGFDIAIIGESHFVMMMVDGACVFVECLACINPLQLGFEPDAIERFDSHRRRISRTMLVQDAIVMAFVDLLPPQNPMFRMQRSCEWIERGGDDLVREFPGKLKPSTRVSVRRVGHGVIVDTLHEYEVDGGLIAPIATKTFIPLHQLHP